jgi:hypothetical protein
MPEREHAPVISKPFDPMTLAFTVRSHLEALQSA